jgi:hypothetical protein
MTRLFVNWFSAAFPSKFLGSLTLAYKLVIFILSVSGVSGAAILAYVLNYPNLSFFLAIIIVFWFSLTAGRALEMPRAPSVEVGPLDLDARMSVFFLTVKNGPVPCRVLVKINPVFDSFGVKLTGKAWEGHWRDRLAEFDGELTAGEEAEYGLLGVGNFPSGNPTLFIYTKEAFFGRRLFETGHNPVTISRDVPLESQGTVILRVVISCQTEQEFGRLQEPSFLIAPDIGSAVGYKIVNRRAKRSLVRKSYKHALHAINLFRRPIKLPRIRRTTEQPGPQERG